METDMDKVDADVPEVETANDEVEAAEEVSS